MQANRELVVEGVGLDVEALPRPVDFSELYRNSNPVEMEIGTGKGTFLTDQAKARPEVNFFGIEWANWFYRYASDRLRRNGCANARMVRAEANYFLTEFVRDASLSVLHVYFPDPWPKKRHHKRRLIQLAFLDLAATRLRPGALVHCATDWEPYAEQMLDVLTAHPDFENTRADGGFAPRPGFRPLTRFEGQGLDKGHVVNDLLFRRVQHRVRPGDRRPA
jgi:tRNA (guanine-N7-)-methyltransferase